MGMKAVFLDRDGVINRYPGDKKYVTSLRAFRFLPLAKKAIALLHREGYLLFVVSNQAGVGKGVYSQKTLDAITTHMLRAVAHAGGSIEKVYYCTHLPDAGCACRKPRDGAIKDILKHYPLDLKKAFFVGDTIRDVETARSAGCKAILVFSGKEKPGENFGWRVKPDFACKNLFEAAKIILKQR
jgi:D-glycero-D-manno-heptose 1,7-bisphosphate phosphatase